MNKYTEESLLLLLSELRAFPRETPWLEFKCNNSDPNRVGKYISGLANSACASNRDFGYLVLGIDDVAIPNGYSRIQGRKYVRKEVPLMMPIRKKASAHAQYNGLITVNFVRKKASLVRIGEAI